MKIQVKPSDNIFSELGNNTYDFKDLLSELIDNSIAARIPGSVVHVVIQIYADSDQKPQRFVVSDDASGIPYDKIGNAITPAGIKTTGSLNEHGLGMKQAVAALGQLEALITKTANAERGLRIEEFRFGEIDAIEVASDKAHGTTISVTHIKPIVTTHAATFTRSIVPYLGARYRRFLRPDKPMLSLVIQIINQDTNDEIYRWNVIEVKPIYFHPGTRENRPVFLQYPLEGNGWTATLTFGYSPREEADYEELGIDSPNKFHPYRVSIVNQGLDVILHDRVILFHQLSELGLISQRHNDYNSVRGELTLLTGFSTAITKNSMIHDAAFSECINQVKSILTGEAAGPNNRTENYLKEKSYPEELPEALLRDRLIDWLANNPLHPRKSVAKEYAIQGIEGFVDILADNEAWEIKKDMANALDVYQLFMYMDIGNVSKGYLVAKEFSNGASIAAKSIKEKHNKEITLAQRSQFPIGHPPTAQEREDYY